MESHRIHRAQVAVIAKTTGERTEDDRNAPGADMIELFQFLCLTITTDDHLVEIERDTERPAEVGQEIIVHSQSDTHANTVVFVDPGVESHQESRETDVDANTKI